MLPLPATPWRIAITDPTRRGWLERARELLRDDAVEFLQLRAHELQPDVFAAAATDLAQIAAQRLILNGPEPLARRLGVHIHLRATSARCPSGLRVFQACHTSDDVRRAAARGAHAALLAPVFAPRSKPNDGRPTLGLRQLRAICAASPIPVLALGGIDAVRHDECVANGAAGTAGMHRYFGDLPQR